MIDEPNRSGCLKLFQDNYKLFRTSFGSSRNHQAWPGGYDDHIRDAMNIGIVLYQTLNQLRSLPFSLSDVLLCVYLHDLEKPWAYENGDDENLRRTKVFKSKENQHAFRLKKMREYNIVLTPEQENGIKYAEGELNDYTPKQRTMGPLAAFSHLCDITSARIWFGFPAESGDPWTGSGRGLS